MIEPIRLDSIKTTDNIPIPIIASYVAIGLSILGAIALVSYHKKKRFESKAE